MQNFANKMLTFYKTTQQNDVRARTQKREPVLNGRKVRKSLLFIEENRERGKSFYAMFCTQKTIIVI